MSTQFKICDSVHGFIRFDHKIQAVIDSRPFQRLRYIRQLGMTYLIYPGAIHTRFEHSLGVMELATRIYETIMAPHHRIVNLDLSDKEIEYWKHILRLASLCHDMGHLPFSHTAEKNLLQDGGHEKMTLKLIFSEELQPVWRSLGPQAEKDIAKLAVGEPHFSLSPWEKMLSQIITEDNFGADRIDYLVRDAKCTGVGYGQLDYSQLIDSLRILPTQEGFTLGVTQSGIQSVESLLIARYMMYARVYQHPKVGVYNNHMNRFMCRLYPDGISSSILDYLEETDYKVLSALWPAAKTGDEDACILLKLKPAFKEIIVTKSVSKAKLNKLKASFKEALIIDEKGQKIPSREFLVLAEDGKIISSLEASLFLRDIPPGGQLRLYADPAYIVEVQQALV